MGVEVYHGFNRGENQIAAASTAQQSLLTYSAEEDTTIAALICEVAFGSEPIDSDGSSAVAGMVFAAISRASIAAPLYAGFQDMSDTSLEDSANDQEADLWAMTPFALVSSGPGTGRSGSVMRVMLVPKTKRKLRRGDTLQIAYNYSNSGANQAVVAWAVTATVVVLT